MQALARRVAFPAAALLAGWVQSLAIADPFTGGAHGWLQVLSLAALVWLVLRTASPTDAHDAMGKPARRAVWRAALLGWLFGLGWLTGTFWWLFISMHVYGGLNAVLTVAAVLALAGFLSIYYAAASAAFAAVASRNGARKRPFALALLFAAVWTLAELARGSWFTGFPWGAGGYAHVDGVLAFLPRYVGVYGLGFVAAALAALLALANRIPWRSARTWAGVTVALLVGAGLWAGRVTAIDADAGADRPASLVMDVALMQGNIPQDEKFVPGRGIVDSLRWYGEQLQDNTATLIVGPETAVPLLPRQLPDGYWDALVQRYQRPGQAALLGIPLGDLETGYTNSVIGLAPGQGAPYRYDKHHLVPFGEFIPPFFRWFTEMMNIPLGDFARGAVGQPSFAWQGQRLAPNICYEDLFGEELAARFVDPAKAPTAFVNVSNIGWFGDSVAIDQHLLISRMRALEFERPMLRATNTGATAIIDHKGQVTRLLPRLTRGVLRGEVLGRTHVTPFAHWASYAGLWPLWAICGLIVFAISLRFLCFPGKS